MTDADLDRRLAEQRAAMISDIATQLDLDAGLREALVAERHTGLVDDLRDILNRDAGLAAIVTPTQPSPSEVARVLESLDAGSRMTQRNHPAVVAFSLVVDRALDLALARALDPNHDHVLEVARALDRALARALAHALDPSPDLDSALARALDLDLGADLARALDLDHDHVLGVASALDRARNDFASVDLRDLDLAGVDLLGVRWSEATTRWPAEIVDKVRRDSVEIEPGLFEIRGGTTNMPTSVNV